jgi:trans-aconitate methyltransferase
LFAAFFGSDVWGGRLLIALLEQGLDIEGVDNSSEMLESCKQRCAQAGFKPTLYLQDIRQLALPHKYGAIIIPVASFQLIHDQTEALAILKILCSYLQPEGILILDTFTPAEDEPVQQTIHRTATYANGSTINLTSGLSKDIQRQIYTSHNHYEKIVGNDIVDTEDEIIKIRWYTEDQLKNMLMQAGFSSYQLVHIAFEDQPVSMYIAHA